MKKKPEYQVKIQVRVNMRLTFFVEVSFATIGEIDTSNLWSFWTQKTGFNRWLDWDLKSFVDYTCK